MITILVHSGVSCVSSGHISFFSPLEITAHEDGGIELNQVIISGQLQGREYRPYHINYDQYFTECKRETWTIIFLGTSPEKVCAE